MAAADTTPITLDAARLANFLSPLEAAPPEKFDALERVELVRRRGF